MQSLLAAIERNPEIIFHLMVLGMFFGCGLACLLGAIGEMIYAYQPRRNRRNRNRRYSNRSHYFR